MASGQQDLRAGDHRAPQEVRREHPGRGVPPDAAVHRERRRRRSRQGVRLRSPLVAVWGGTRAAQRRTAHVRGTYPTHSPLTNTHTHPAHTCQCVAVPHNGKNGRIDGWCPGSSSPSRPPLPHPRSFFMKYIR